MKPIRYELQQKPKYVSHWREIEDGYKLEEFYGFEPEFLEEIYDGTDAERLKSNNSMILEFNNKKDKMTYLATFKDRRLHCEQVEYFQDENGNIIQFLINIPNSNKYYPAVMAVAVLKKVIKEVS